MRSWASVDASLSVKRGQQPWPEPSRHMHASDIVVRAGGYFPATTSTSSSTPIASCPRRPPRPCSPDSAILLVVPHFISVHLHLFTSPTWPRLPCCPPLLTAPPILLFTVPPPSPIGVGFSGQAPRSRQAHPNPRIRPLALHNLLSFAAHCAAASSRFPATARGLRRSPSCLH